MSLLCKKPYRQASGSEFGCGQCKPCRLNYIRQWTARLILESYVHEKLCFVTLTYAHLLSPATAALLKWHIQDWLKRLRENGKRKYGPQFEVRYYVSGEYGSRYGRPHYHAMLFGTDDLELIEKTWGHGMVHIGTVTPDSIAYILKYLVKNKLEREKEKEEGNRPAEFSMMSRKPGIGAGYDKIFHKAMDVPWGKKWIEENGDVPHEFIVGGRKWPIPLYVRQKMRALVGLDSRSVKLPGTRQYELQEKRRKEAQENFTKTNYGTIRNIKYEKIVELEEGKLQYMASMRRVRAKL